MALGDTSGAWAPDRSGILESSSTETLWESDGAERIPVLDTNSAEGQNQTCHAWVLILSHSSGFRLLQT